MLKYPLTVNLPAYRISVPSAPLLILLDDAFLLWKKRLGKRRHIIGKFFILYRNLYHNVLHFSTELQLRGLFAHKMQSIRRSDRDVRVIFLLISDLRNRAVAGIYFHIIREDKYFLPQRCDQFTAVSRRQIRAADRFKKQGIAAE